MEPAKCTCHPHSTHRELQLGPTCRLSARGCCMPVCLAAGVDTPAFLPRRSPGPWSCPEGVARFMQEVAPAPDVQGHWILRV